MFVLFINPVNCIKKNTVFPQVSQQSSLAHINAMRIRSPHLSATTSEQDKATEGGEDEVKILSSIAVDPLLWQ